MTQRSFEDLMATEKEVLSDAVVAALHALLDLASSPYPVEVRMDAATRILAYATELELPYFAEPEESEEVTDGDNNSSES